VAQQCDLGQRATLHHISQLMRQLASKPVSCSSQAQLSGQYNRCWWNLHLADHDQFDAGAITPFSTLETSTSASIPDDDHSERTPFVRYQAWRQIRHPPFIKPSHESRAGGPWRCPGLTVGRTRLPPKCCFMQP
jgi:hypothetical protein